MSVDFDRTAAVKRSKHDLDEFLDYVPRVVEERAEVLAEQDLNRFRVGLVPGRDVIGDDSLRTSLRVFWLDAEKHLKPNQGLKQSNTYARELSRVLSYEWAEALPDQNGLVGKPRKKEDASMKQEPYGRAVVETRVVSLGKMHAMFWLALVLTGIFWGVAAGASIFAGVGLSSTVATFGVLGTIALSATAFALSLQNVAPQHER
jgi:hypothetical protein